MIAPFDVFEKDAAGPMWIGEANSVEEAQTLCKGRSNYQEKKYFVLSLKTSNRLDLNLDETPRDSVVE
jgi:hypothetical protein